jgi:hypothetical protein
MPDPTSAYDADFRRFSAADRGTILDALKRFVADASESQHRAWRDSIPQLQNEVREVVVAYGDAGAYHAVLEYRLPMEFRRIDAVFLLRGMVVVLELKGKWTPSDADVDQAHAYARDLRCYHAECAERPVEVVLVPTLARDLLDVRRGVHVCAPSLLDGLIARFDRETRDAPPISLERFLDAEAARPSTCWSTTRPSEPTTRRGSPRSTATIRRARSRSRSGSSSSPSGSRSGASSSR